MHAGDKSARSELIEHNLRLVAHIVKKYYAAYSDQDDLISIGTVGLIKAIDSFKPDKGTRLATYAAKCVENAILSQRNNRRLKWKTMNLLGQNGLCSAA
ncbi:MAG: sigma-70 family RNA polymerase sigma factor [Ruminococcus sp.]|nr:sigma-70 family RNA polymerase sigma factor [Ruminococcus sp.]